MNRRALLAMAGSALPAFAGCADLVDDQPTKTRVDRSDAGPVPEFEECPPFVTTERADCVTADPAVTLTPSSRVFEEYEADDDRAVSTDA